MNLRHANDRAEMPAGAASGVAPAVRTRGGIFEATKHTATPQGVRNESPKEHA